VGCAQHVIMALESTGNARVTRRRGRFVIDGTSPDGNVDKLLGVARDVEFDPKPAAK